jgi:hypothetical protein
VCYNKATKRKGDNKMPTRINYKEVCVVTQCPFCGRGNEVEVNEADYWDWDDGMMAQDAFPYLSVDEREMLISGICPTCWDKMFGSDEEPDPDEVDIHGNTFGGEE